MRLDEGIFGLYSRMYENRREVEYSLEDYLRACSDDASFYAGAAERLLKAIGEPVMVDTAQDPRLGRIFMNRTIKVYPAFADDFFGMEDTIERIVGFFRHAAQGLEERKQVLYLLGPVGGGKSSLAERLKQLMEKEPVYVLKAGKEISPVFESPLGLFDPVTFGEEIEKRYGVPKRRLTGTISPWAIKRLEEFGGDITKFTVVRMQPSRLKQICVAKTEPGDENNQDVASLVGKVDIRKLEMYSQNDPDAYSFSGGLNRTTQGLMEFVEMFKAPIKMLHPLLTATQEGNYAGTENIGGIPYQGIIVAHSNEAEWQSFKNNKNNEAFMDRISTRFAFKVLSGTFNFDTQEIAADPVHLMYVLEQSIWREQFPEETEKKYLNFIKAELAPRYAEFIGHEIQKAYLESYSDYGQNLFDRYVAYADAWIEDQDYKDADTGQLMNRELLNQELSKIEKPAGIANPKDFRNEVVKFALRARAASSGRNPSWTSYEKLREVIERRMFSQVEDLLPVISFGSKKDSDTEKKHADFVDRMVERGYTERQVRRLVEWYMRVNKAG